MRRVLLFGAALLLHRSLVFAAQPSFHGIGDLPGGTFYSRADAVSNGGTVVVGASGVENNRLEGFRWTPKTGIQKLPADSNGTVRSISDVTPDGTGVFGWKSLNPPLSSLAEFRWSETAGFEYPLGLDEAPSASAEIFAAYDGQTIATSVLTSQGREAVSYSPATGVQFLGDFPGGSFSSEARDISGDGTTVVGYGHMTDGPDPTAFRWTEPDGMADLGVGPDGLVPYFAEAASFDGSVVVGFGGREGDPAWQAFRWTEVDGLEFLPLMSSEGAGYAQAFDVSADGSRIVGFDTNIGAFLWTEARGMERLSTVLGRERLGSAMSGWTLTEARAISADGKSFAGVGFRNGSFQGWVATVPEPSGVVLVLITCAVGLAMRRVRRPI